MRAYASFLAAAAGGMALLAAGCADKAADVRPVSARHCPDPSALFGDVAIDGGVVQLGSDRFYPEERPIRTVEIAPFVIDATEVTNAQFAAFVEAENYVTRAERGLPEEAYADVPDVLRAPGSAVFTPPLEGGNPASWWRFAPGASWRAPEGPGSSIDGRDHYPVVHITHEDALAYALWRGRRLPTEAEWEAAARGGLVGASYAWGETPPDSLETPAANTWQGLFPFVDKALDGFAGVAPVGCYAPNGFGSYDALGNVWEWTSDPYYPDREGLDDPEAPPEGFDPRQPGVAVGVVKGGSHLCAENYCVRFRPAARQAQELIFATSHIGFRTAADAP
ncbi:MAG: formylglycine-generating enzyme family protein [Caulobacterales bacterium]|nr:formylglycine-generating enzyme family protein [Caulobacterales bacterium]